MIRYALFRLLAWGSQRLPLWLTYAVMVAIADLVYLVMGRRRAIVKANMRQVLGLAASEQRVARVARDSARNYARYAVDFLRFPRLTRADVQRLIPFDGWERFDQARSKHRGIVFVTMHLGHWDLAGAAVGARYPMIVLVDRLEPPRYHEYVQRARARVGLRIVLIERALREVIRALKRNEAVGILVDRPVTAEEGGVPVRFFEGTVHVPAGAARLALRTGAIIVPGAVVRRPDQTFLAILNDIIDYAPTGDRERDVQVVTQRMMSSLEQIIRRYPDQWYMFRPFWNGRGNELKGMRNESALRNGTGNPTHSSALLPHSSPELESTG